MITKENVEQSSNSINHSNPENRVGAQINKADNFINSALILALAGIIVKILGAAYKIPLGGEDFLGEIGAGFQGFAYPYFNFANSILITGFPIAIAKLISESDAQNNPLYSEKIFIVTRRMMAVIGFSIAFLLFLASPVITASVGQEDATYTMQAISIAIFFVALAFSYKGYFQGKKNLKYYAQADIIEQLIKVIIGVIAVLLLRDIGIKYASAGAILGVALGALGAAFLLHVNFKKLRRKEIHKNRVSVTLQESKEISKKVLTIVVPITIGAVLINFVSMIEGLIVIDRLKSVGITAKQAGVLYGYHSYYSASIVNFPQILFNPVSVAIFPVIASMIALNQMEEFKKAVAVGSKAVLLISLPCFAGMFVLSSEVLSLLWPGLPEMVTHTSVILKIMSFMLVALSIYGISTAVLNAMGRPKLPSMNLVIGAVFKILICYFLTVVPGIGYLSAPIGSATSYIIAMSLNIYHINKYSDKGIDFKAIISKPLLASLSMGASVYLAKLLLLQVIGAGRLLTLICVLVGVISYIVFLILFRCIGEEEIKFLPGKRVLSKVFLR